MISKAENSHLRISWEKGTRKNPAESPGGERQSGCPEHLMALNSSWKMPRSCFYSNGINSGLGRKTEQGKSGGKSQTGEEKNSIKTQNGSFVLLWLSWNHWKSGGWEIQSVEKVGNKEGKQGTNRVDNGITGSR